MTPLRIIMLSYERGFLDPRSEATARLQKMASEETKVTAIVLSGNEKKSVNDEKMHVIGLAGNGVVRFFQAIRTAIKEAKKAKKAGESVFVTAQDPFVAGLIAFITSRWSNIPYEVQEHADYFSSAWERELPVIHETWAWIGKGILRRADHVRVVSERIRDRVIRFGVPAERISIIPVAQDVTTLLHHQTRVWPETPTIVVPCRFVKQKGLDVLLKSFATLAKDGVSFHARLIGEGSQGPKLAELASKLGIRDRVTFEEWSTPDAIWKDADLFVLSSRYEGWGRTIVEAMAAGVPIVTTDVGCVGSFFRPQVDGRVVQPNDVQGLAAAIREQLTEKGRREWMVKNAREQVKELPHAEVLIKKQHAAWRDPRPPTPDNRSAWKWTTAVIGFALIVRALSLVLFADSLGPNREWGFFTLVQHWFQGYGYSFVSQAGCVSAYRSPGFLFFLTAVYGLFGFANFFAQAVVQNLLAVLLAYLVYRLGWRITSDRRVGWMAALIVTLHPYTFYHYTQYYHTVLSGVFLVSLLLCLFALERTKKWKWAWIAGVMTAGLAYIQGTILPVMPLLSVWLIWRWRKEWKAAIVAIAMIAVTSAGLIMPWTIRNWQVFHQFIPLTTDLGHALAKANNENILGLTLLGFPQEVQTSDVSVDPEDPQRIRYTIRPEAEAALRERGWFNPSPLLTESHPREPSERHTACADMTTSEPEFNAYWTNYGMDWLKSNYGTDGWKLQALKVGQFWSPSLQPAQKYGASWSFAGNPVLESGARGSLILFTLFVEVMSLGAIIFSARRKRLMMLVPILAVLLIYTVMHSFFAGYTKYRIPLDNLLAVLAAISVIALWDRLRRSKKK